MEKLKHWRGDRLRSLRKEHGLTQQEVADRLNTQQSLYARFENEHSTPTLDVAVRIVHEFNVSLDWLAGLSENRDPQLFVETLSEAETHVLLALRRGDLKALLTHVLAELNSTNPDAENESSPS